MFKLRVRVTAGARRERIALAGDLVRVWVGRPPIDGQANRRLEEMLAGYLGVRPSDVRVAAGQGSPVKMVEIDGLDRDEGIRRLSVHW